MALQKQAMQPFAYVGTCILTKQSSQAIQTGYANDMLLNKGQNVT